MSSFLETITLASVGIIGAAIGAAASIVAVKENSSLTAKQNLEVNKNLDHQELQGYKFYLYQIMYRYVFAFFQFQYHNNELNIVRRLGIPEAIAQSEGELKMWRADAHQAQLEELQTIRDFHKLLIDISRIYKGDQRIREICNDLLKAELYQPIAINFSSNDIAFNEAQEAVMLQGLLDNWNEKWAKPIEQLLDIFEKESYSIVPSDQQNEKPLMITSAYYWFKNEILEAWNDEW